MDVEEGEDRASFWLNSGYFNVEIFWSNDDQLYVAIAPDLPGCSAVGKTRAEAAKEIDVAIMCWIEASMKAGNEIPEPSAH